MADSPRFPVRFDAEALAEDLAHASARGREVGLGERIRLERDGIAVSELRACATEGRDGTRLAGCVKSYMPRPNGPWGMVFTGDREPTPVSSSSPSACAIRAAPGDRASTRSPTGAYTAAASAPSLVPHELCLLYTSPSPRDRS